MSDSFDPYHKLLGISKREQPPTLYRLLGLEMFESDREVIDAAANRQMTYLQGCCNGAHAASAEQLMNEISNARLRLLNPQSKVTYDEQLCASLSPQQPAEQASESDVAAHIRPVNATPVLAVPQIRQNRRIRKKRSGGVQWIAGAVMSFAVVWVAWKVGLIDVGGRDSSVSHITVTRNAELLRPREERPSGTAAPYDNRSRTSASADTPSMPRPSSNWSRSQTQTKMQSAKTLSPGSSVGLNRSSSMTRGPVDDLQRTRQFSSAERERMEGFKKLATMPDSTSSAPRGDPAGRDLSANVRGAQTRVPVPSENELAEANVAVDSAFAAQIKAAKTPHENQHLGNVIVAVALETKSLTDRYALLKTALETSTDAGDFNGGMSTLDQMNEQFEIPELEQRLAVMQKLEPLLYRPLDQVAMADQAEMLIDRAMIQENYAVASGLCEVGQKLSQDLRNLDMGKKFSIKIGDVGTLQSQHATVVLARERLASEPDNAKANEFLGRFLCFGKSQWNEGLPYLGRSEDTTLRELAAADMRPESTAAQLESIADRWWEFSIAAEAQPLVMRTSRQRAIDSYRRAIAHGLSGLAKATAEKRVASVQADASSDFAITRTPNAEMGEPKRPLMLGMMLRDGVWYDALNERQHFFLWDVRNRQPEPGRNEAWAAIDESTTLWHDFNIHSMYFAIEWGRE